MAKAPAAIVFLCSKSDNDNFILPNPYALRFTPNSKILVPPMGCMLFSATATMRLILH